MHNAIYTPFAQRDKAARELVEVELSPDMIDLDIVYHSPTSGDTKRRIKPLALRFLKEGEIALVAQCRLREEFRTFAFDRISSVTFPGFSGKVMTGPELTSLFAVDLERLYAHEVTINGPKPSTNRAKDILFEYPEQESVTLDATTYTTEESPAVKASSAVVALCHEMQTYIDEISGNAPKPGFAMTVSLLMDGESGTEVFVDVPTWVATMGRDGSSHARMAYIQKKRGITQAALKLAEAVRQSEGPFYATSSIRVAAARSNKKDKSIFRLAVDDIWIHPKRLASSTLGANLQKKLTHLPKSRTEACFTWMMETDVGMVRARASTPEAAIERIAVLLGKPIAVYAVGQQIETPVELHIRRSKAA